MGINTLGDLARCSEQELLASKNFGETSLDEIRDMLMSKGLELGQFAHEKLEPEPAIDMSNLSPDEQALVERPIADLNLSVRARKCMVRRPFRRQRLRALRNPAGREPDPRRHPRPVSGHRCDRGAAGRAGYRLQRT